MVSSDCTLDPAALASIAGERLDWRFKSIPAGLWGLTLAEAAARRPNLFTDGFVGPVVVLEAGALDHNLRTMAQWCDRAGVRLAPHGKTTMAPQLFARQAEHGAWGITAANTSQLRVYRAFGVSRVLLANQLVDPAALRWLGAELDAHPEFEFSCWVDSVTSVELMTEALAGVDRPVDVLVELGGDGGRTGVRDLATGLAVAEAAHASPALRLAGTGGYEGALAHDPGERSRDVVAAYLRNLRELTREIADRGLFARLDQVIVTAGGSAYFDQVAAALTEDWGGLPVVPVLRSGAYVTHDDGFYRGISPLGEHPRIDGTPPFRSALRAWAQVTSRPTDELALLTLGKRDASFDEGLPEPQWHRRPGGEPEKLAGHTVTALNDQHAFLALPPDSPLRVGDWVGLGLSHPCTVFDKWPLLPVVDGDTVVGFVRTYF
ncbi:amino acid deaminase [Amycolatopsis thermophila]|uniref:D-serine deaminase-like pyridoxal phosphate-dependent protein n=1 Tax=Amycolatopsis thermophila TaxID=206084 RepID=A0ABU0F3N4_9PSEU|nr:amino acid deaminase [Amycolatopsis thermophila]MDQ0382185.1 D-serine deaminase-like pyridoxal phosphate-dependent protein [Amycolatopsis thermophila]